MQDTASVRPQLVESLYVEALALSDSEEEEVMEAPKKPVAVMAKKPRRRMARRARQLDLFLSVDLYASVHCASPCGRRSAGEMS